MGVVAVPVMLLTLLPISFAGWGVREAALVSGFDLLDVPSELALATSIGFGLSGIVASLPGLFSLSQKHLPWRTLFQSSELRRS